MTATDLFGSMVLVEQSRPSGFDAFYRIYPRKVGKREAEKAYRAAIKRGADPDAILAGAKRYAEKCADDRTIERYIKHPGPWLNAERWLDQPSNAPLKAPSFMDIVRG